MQVIDSKIYYWHEKVWKQIQTMGAQLPHALLFHGQAGIGKVDFVRHLGQSLLCEQPVADGHACGICVSCRWFADRAHMDFRMLRPETIDVAEGLEADDGEAEAVSEADTSEKKAKKAPSKDIRIEQVRALAGFLNIGTHRGGRRIVILYPLQAMNVYTANALLKMLEEPPPKTVFLLVADSLERVLPTILSRCRHVQMPMPEPGGALDWLKAQGFTQAEAATALAEQGGAPLSARTQLAQGEKSEKGETGDTVANRRRLLSYLSEPEKGDPLQIAEQLQHDLPRVLGWLQRWLYDCLSYSSARRIRYYPGYEKQIATLVAKLSSAPFGPVGNAALWSLDKKLYRARRVVQHPLNAKLFVESLLLDYADGMHQAWLQTCH